MKKRGQLPLGNFSRFPHGIRKRGVSAVVAVILMILITVGGVVIIWSVIVPLVKDNIFIGDLDGDLSIVTSEGYTAYDSSAGVAIVQIKRGTDDSVMNKAEIIFTIDGDVLDSGIAPGVNVPEVGGMEKKDLFYLLKKIFPIARAIDVVEVVPEKDVDGKTVKVAGEIVKKFLHSFNT